MKIQDHSISKEFFELVYHPELEMFATHPQPNANELIRYYKSQTYISHTDSQQSFFDQIYQSIKKKTIKNKLALIEQFNQSDEKTVLDIGCGTGDFLLKAQKENWRVVGVEPNFEARTLAQKKLRSDTKLYTNIEDLLEENQNQFQIITLWHVLEHVPNFDDYISKIKKLLHPQGTLFVAVPNFNSYDAKFYHAFWAAFDVPRHLWHFSQNAIEKIFLNSQMKIIDKKPMLFDSFYVSLLSEKYLGMQWNIFRAFFVGLISNLKARANFEYSSIIYIIKNQNNQN